MRVRHAPLRSCLSLVAFVAGSLGCGGSGAGTEGATEDTGVVDVDTGVVDLDTGVDSTATVDTSVAPPIDAADDAVSPDTSSADAADGGVDAVATGDVAADGGEASADAGAAADATAAADAADATVTSPWDPRCTACHGSVNPAPPRGFNGETLTSEPAVGAHQAHLGPSSWHREVACSECHIVPTVPLHDPAVPTHQNSVDDVVWGPLAKAGTWSPTALTCTGTWCHGGELLPDIATVTTVRAPVWTTVDGTQSRCGKACHSTPPGGKHTGSTGCPGCHAEVIATFDPATGTATWKNAALHIDGKVQATSGHDLPNWTSPKTSPNHHGTAYFIGNHQKDEHGQPCTACHGAALDGGTSGVSCNNASCHRGTDWRSCSFCHGTAPSQSNPPLGVGGETTTGTLAVGRHVAHLAAGTSHVAFACATCHVVPAAGDVAHAIDYAPSASLATAGHHGDVAFSLGGAGGTFNVNATQGTPETARGTCVGGCHSNGRGGAPRVTPYWAGGAWTPGDCTACHANSMGGGLGGRHSTHNGEINTCASCHPDAASGTHMNGAKDVKGTVTGQPVTVTPAGASGNPCGSRAACNGTCHGKTHTNYCW
jgi:predicted CxxxxCH...CXXCH cytochrome family protein